ncbi:hypothetical protein WDU94_007154 [Cyamophila willieti]
MNSPGIHYNLHVQSSIPVQNIICYVVQYFDGHKHPVSVQDVYDMVKSLTEARQMWTPSPEQFQTVLSNMNAQLHLVKEAKEDTAETKLVQLKKTEDKKSCSCGKCARKFGSEMNSFSVASSGTGITGTSEINSNRTRTTLGTVGSHRRCGKSCRGAKFSAMGIPLTSGNKGRTNRWNPYTHSGKSGVTDVSDCNEKKENGVEATWGTSNAFL